MTSDLLGLRPERPPCEHVRQYAQVGEDNRTGARAYREEVETRQFP